MNLPAWLGLGWGAPGDAGDPLVWLDPYHSPATPFEEHVYWALAAGPRRRSELTALLAEWEARAEHARGGWALELGAAALPALLPQAEADLDRLDGSLVAIETPAAVRSIVQQHWALGLSA